MAPLGAVLSGINKLPRSGSIYCSFLGLADDEHDPTFHGGPDKAIHQYCTRHYAEWARLYPKSEEKFGLGGFGENLVVEGEGWDEEGVCVGDVVSISRGDEGVLLEVSLPRQPCFKITTRFAIKGLAAQTHKLNRTGWYYRVLQEGYIEAGMVVRVVKRPNPSWTIARCHELIHRSLERESLVEGLELAALGAEGKGYFARRLAELEEREKPKKKAVWKRYTVAGKKIEGRVVRLSFDKTEKAAAEEDAKPGSYVRIKLPNGLRRAYSVVSGTPHRFDLAVALEPSSRGGSSYVHNSLRIGDELRVSEFVQSVPGVGSASHHVFIVGGIGITAFLALCRKYEANQFSYEVHYAIRSAEDVACREIVEGLRGMVRIYDKSRGERLDVKGVLEGRRWNSQVYVCGPTRMTEAVKLAARELGVLESEVHYEAFVADVGGDPFTVEVAGTGQQPKDESLKANPKIGEKPQILTVGEDQTLLQVLRQAGLEIESSCEVGNCGTCRVKVCSGEVVHRGSGLGEEEKRDWMLSCVSRGVGTLVVEVPEV
jgi:MOSC domain-containing protein YiiM/ferredoxin-NADP reductase